MSAQPAGELDTEAVPATMLAWQVTGPGDPSDVLSLNEIDVPVPGPGEVLVEVWCAGLGLADVQLMRGGVTSSPETLTLPFTPGLELCGEVVAVGEGISRSRLGERVLGVTAPPHGSLAKYAIARAKDVLPAPNRLDDTSASVFHVAYQTGWMGLYRRASIRVGETLLVHAAAGGLGGAAVQLGRAAGATVIGVVGSAEKVGVARVLGAQHVIDRSREDVVAAVRALTAGSGADVVYDPVGGAAFQRSVRSVAFEGRIVVAGFASGEETTFTGSDLLAGNFSVFGVGWGHYLDARPEIVVRAHADLSSLAEVGALRPHIGAKLAFEDAPEGLNRLLAGTSVGRVAVTPP